MTEVSDYPAAPLPPAGRVPAAEYPVAAPAAVFLHVPPSTFNGVALPDLPGYRAYRDRQLAEFFCALVDGAKGLVARENVH